MKETNRTEHPKKATALNVYLGVLVALNGVAAVWIWPFYLSKVRSYIQPFPFANCSTSTPLSLTLAMNLINCVCRRQTLWGVPNRHQISGKALSNRQALPECSGCSGCLQLRSNAAAYRVPPLLS
jgi:hypothetical protein